MWFPELLICEQSPVLTAIRASLRARIELFSQLLFIGSLSVSAHYHFLQVGRIFCFHQSAAVPPCHYTVWISSVFCSTPPGGGEKFFLCLIGQEFCLVAGVQSTHQEHWTMWFPLEQICCTHLAKLQFCSALGQHRQVAQADSMYLNLADPECSRYMPVWSTWTSRAVMCYKKLI
jgi:hypothetical protein